MNGITFSSILHYTIIGEYLTHSNNLSVVFSVTRKIDSGRIDEKMAPDEVRRDHLFCSPSAEFLDPLWKDQRPLRGLSVWDGAEHDTQERLEN